MTAYIWWKRWIEVAIALLLLLITLPIILFCIFWIPRKSKGNPIYRQKRLKKNREIFTAYKLRTRDINTAELEAKNGMTSWGNHDSDIGIFPFGRLLRQFSIDELPQLINVLKGDMALVGPRAPQPGEVSQKGDFDYEERFTVDQGITGFAQTHGRDDLTTEEKYAADVFYAKHQDMSLDLYIMIKTIFVVLSKTGK